MNKLGSKIKDNTKRGDWAELCFMARATELQLHVSKPWGNSYRYDVGIECGGKLLRVQVKCTMHKHPDGKAYVCTTRGHNVIGGHYIEKEIDFLVAYIIPENIWYIFPARVSSKLKWSIYLRPEAKGEKYGRYKEAWELLLSREKRAKAKAAGAGGRD
ncbi:MAG: putative endonuclease [Acidobacteriaceae bacterium]|nr:putative endonuclease [Acidobacteriaceae bacterium]